LAEPNAVSRVVGPDLRAARSEIGPYLEKPAGYIIFDLRGYRILENAIVCGSCMFAGVRRPECMA
jgi:hypothetical protein